jgi:hypothetical protein
MSKVGSGDSKNTLYCSFCGKSQHEVRSWSGQATRATENVGRHSGEMKLAAQVPDLPSPDRAPHYQTGRLIPRPPIYPGVSLRQGQVASTRYTLRCSNYACCLSSPVLQLFSPASREGLPNGRTPTRVTVASLA